MRRLLTVSILLGLLVLIGWISWNWPRWQNELTCYRVATAENFEAAAGHIAWFDSQPRGVPQSSHARQEKLRVLVARFGTGNERLDNYLMRYAYDARASEDFREVLSREFGWRPEVIGYWAELWKSRFGDPDRERESIERYLDLLAAADPPRKLTWREVLDAQAILALTGRAERARRLTPENWQRRWKRDLITDYPSAGGR
jgi:hypothetical protein